MPSSTRTIKATLTLFGVAALALSAATSASATTVRPNVSSGDVGRMVDDATGRCLDSNASGSAYTLPCNGGNFQNWLALYVDDAYELEDYQTDLCLAVGSGNYLVTETCAPQNTAQKWSISQLSSNLEKFTSELNNYPLDSNASGSVYVDPSNGGAFQKWDF